MTLEMLPRSLLDEYAVNLARLVVMPLTEGDVTPNPPGATKQTERLDEGTKEIEE